MKTRVSGIIILGFAALALLAGEAAAQRIVYVADIPFSFTVNDVTLPPGKYEISQRLQIGDSWDFLLMDAKGAVKVIFGTESAERMSRQPNAELSFDEIGGRYFLSQLWLADTTDGFYVPKSREERALMKDGARPKKSGVNLTKK